MHHDHVSKGKNSFGIGQVSKVQEGDRPKAFKQNIGSYVFIDGGHNLFQDTSTLTNRY